MAAVATDGFFSGWNADKVLNFGMQAYQSKIQGDQADADKSKADATAAAYAAQQQRTVPQSMFSGIDKRLLIGGSIGGAVLLVLLLKAK